MVADLTWNTDYIFKVLMHRSSLCDSGRSSVILVGVRGTHHLEYSFFGAVAKATLYSPSNMYFLLSRIRQIHICSVAACSLRLERFYEERDSLRAYAAEYGHGKIKMPGDASLRALRDLCGVLAPLQEATQLLQGNGRKASISVYLPVVHECLSALDPERVVMVDSGDGKHLDELAHSDLHPLVPSTHVVARWHALNVACSRHERFVVRVALRGDVSATGFDSSVEGCAQQAQRDRKKSHDSGIIP